MDVSIIIVNYNVEHFLSQCLQSVRNGIQVLQNAGFTSEVFVVDNRSMDGSCDMVRRDFPEVNLIALSENEGFSKANNRAIGLAKGKWILLLNPDTVIPEEALLTCLEFANAHPKLGGLGVPMLDGRGRYLPESKRGMPSPWVAFCKISGLYRLAKKSQRFNHYYMGQLPPDESNRIEILSGAFMWMRMEALEQVGVLDETYFMYGEDIDLSWRLLEGGWENHYCAETSIIHYKGESTKKGSLNYVLVFYNAMQIFAQRHFSGSRGRAFLVLIQLAIYFRAGLAIISRLLKKISLPIAEWALIWASLVAFVQEYGEWRAIAYDWNLALPATASYAAVWLLSIKFLGGYDRPWKWTAIAKGIAFGTLFLLAVYGLLPESMRFSRATLLFGSALVPAVIALVRRILARNEDWKHKQSTRRLYIAGPSELLKVHELVVLHDLEAESMHSIKALLPMAITEFSGDHHPLHGQVTWMGTLKDLQEAIRIHKCNEVVLSGRDLTAAQIIESMSLVANSAVNFRIAWTQGGQIVGSGGPEQVGSITEWRQAIYLPQAKRVKRTFDFCTSIVLLTGFPILLVTRRFSWLICALDVLVGRSTWVGFTSDSPPRNSINSFIIPRTKSREERVRHRTLLTYVRDYRWTMDLGVILEALISQRAIHRHGHN